MPSTVIKSYRYFPQEEILRIEYVSGIVYDYLKVPQDVFDDFRSAFSKGVYLNRNIKGRFEFIKIEDYI